MTWLFEQQLVIVALGVGLILALGAAWSASGRNELLYCLGAAFVLLIAGLITERMVVTDREAIHATLLTIARDVQNNNRRAVLAHIYSGAPELRKKADAELPSYQFTECRVTKIHKIEVDRSAEPHSAIEGLWHGRCGGIGLGKRGDAKKCEKNKDVFWFHTY